MTSPGTLLRHRLDTPQYEAPPRTRRAQLDLRKEPEGTNFWQSGTPPVPLGIPWPALRGPFWNHFWKKRRPEPYWGGENSGNALEGSNALNYRVCGIPAVVPRGIPGNALRAFPGSFRNFSGKSQPYWGCGPDNFAEGKCLQMIFQKISQKKEDIIFTGFWSISGYVRNLRGSLFSSEKFSSGQVRPRQGTEICNFGAPSPLEALHWIFWADDAVGSCAIDLQVVTLPIVGTNPLLPHSPHNRLGGDCFFEGFHGRSQDWQLSDCRTDGPNSRQNLPGICGLMRSWRNIRRRG